MTAQIPKIKFDDFQKFVTSPEIVAIASAIIVTPLLIGAIGSFIDNVPFFRDHATIALIAAGFVVFIFAAKMKGMFRSILIGIAGGLLITAIEPLISDALGG